MMWTFNETTRILFPGASITVLLLMEHGDLQRVLPDWIERLIGAYEATSSAMHYIARCRTAWNDLIHEYDLAVEAEARAVRIVGFTSATDIDDTTRLRIEADAALIASAPDLLAALKRARAFVVKVIEENVTGIDFDPAEHLLVKQIDAALKKAEEE